MVPWSERASFLLPEDQTRARFTLRTDNRLALHDLDISGQIDTFMICRILAPAAGWEPYNLHDAQQDMFCRVRSAPCTDPAKPLTTAGDELQYITL